MRGLSLVAASGGHSSSRCAGLSLSRPLLLRSTGSRPAGSVAVAHRPVAPRHVGSSQTRARTRVPCIGRQILNHCATREAPLLLFFKSWKSGCFKLSRTWDLGFGQEGCVWLQTPDFQGICLSITWPEPSTLFLWFAFHLEMNCSHYPGECIILHLASKLGSDYFKWK